MPMDFTVIQAVRQRFGDRDFEYDEFPLEQEAPFVGLKEEYQFACPGINPRETGVLQFESLGVTAGAHYFFAPQYSGKRNILRINGVDIPGGITPGAYRSAVGYNWHYWKAHTLLVPANILGENNVLYIESIRVPVSGRTSFDNFIIDNVVVFYKTTQQRPERDLDVEPPRA